MIIFRLVIIASIAWATNDDQMSFKQVEAHLEYFNHELYLFDPSRGLRIWDGLFFVDSSIETYHVKWFRRSALTCIADFSVWSLHF